MSNDLNGWHIKIGPAEIYDKVVELGAKVSLLLAYREDSVKDHADYESRLRALERARWPLPALAALVSVAALLISLVKFV